MQGTAADLIKLAMIAVQGWLEREKLATKLIMQVHDELVLEVPEGELARVKPQVEKLMTGVADARRAAGGGGGRGRELGEGALSSGSSLAQKIHT